MERITRTVGRAHASRSAFTLVELMVVAAIIAILASMALGGMVMARRSADVDRTKATIAKIDSVIRPMYDEFKYRRVPIKLDLIRINYLDWTPAEIAAAEAENVERQKALPYRRLAALRDLMRLELPERKTDVMNPGGSDRGPLDPSMASPSLHRAYYSRLSSATLTGNSSAECLYLVVTIGGGEDARRLFQDSEIADTDKNGLMEFVDAWGNPIQWLRWAPGFNESDVQPNVSTDSEKDAACTNDHDPFDTRKIDVIGTAIGDYRRGWRLVPLIYSAGPDGEYGLAVDSPASPWVWTTFDISWSYVTVRHASSHYQAMWGRADGTGSHYDNIHNHAPK